MNKKNLLILVGVCIALLVVFVFAQRIDKGTELSKERTLYSDVDAQQIGKIVIEQGKDKLELALVDGVWSVASRANYPADPGKIRALVLKVLDLSVSQEITESEAKYDSLGVAAAGEGKSTSEVKLLSKDSKELAALLLGNLRKKEDGGSFSAPTGQYVRRAERKEVYLISQPITTSASPLHWLNTEVVNVLQNKIELVSGYRISPEGGETLDYALVRKLPPAESGPKQFILSAPPEAEGKTPLDAEAGLVRSGLENVTLSDVFPAGDEAVKATKFDRRVVYTLDDGLQYTVWSAQKGEGASEKTLIKISVAFDGASAERFFQEEKTDRESRVSSSSSTAAKASSSSADEDEDQAQTSSSAAGPKLSSAEEANALNKHFSSWVYEIAAFQGKKYRVTLDGLLKAPPAVPPPPAAPVAAPASGSAPLEKP